MLISLSFLLSPSLSQQFHAEGQDNPVSVESLGGDRWQMGELVFEADVRKDSMIVDKKELADRTKFTVYRETDTGKVPVKRIYRNGAEQGEKELAYILQRQQTQIPDMVPGVKVAKRFEGKALDGLAVIASQKEIQSLEDSYDLSTYRNKMVHASLNESVPRIGGEKLYELGLNGSGVDISILDTGVDYTHESFGSCSTQEFQDGNCRVEGGYDIYAGDSDPMDEEGHGTHVASTAAGMDEKYRGVAYGADIWAYRVLGPDGGGTYADIIEGIEKSLDPNNDGDTSDHVDIASLSLGGSGSSDSPVAEAVDNAVEQGMVVVVSAGNSGGYGTIGTPGNARKALSVGASNRNDDIASFSSRGPTYWQNGSVSGTKPDLLAPGTGITAAKLNGGYLSLSGTSMAAPHVAGAAALILEEKDYNTSQLRSVLKTTSNDINEDVFTQGAGRLNLTSAYNSTVYFNDTTLEFGRVGQEPISNSFRVSEIEQVSDLYLSATSPVNISSGQCQPGVGFSRKHINMEGKTSASVELNVESPDKCSGVLAGTAQIKAESGGRNTTYRVPYNFVAKEYVEVTVSDEDGNLMESKVRMYDASTGVLIEEKTTATGSVQIQDPGKEVVVSASGRHDKDLFILQKESSSNQIQLSLSKAENVSLPGTRNGEKLRYMETVLAEHSNRSIYDSSVSEGSQPMTGSQYFMLDKVPDGKVDWNISLSAIALPMKENCTSSGCDNGLDERLELTDRVYALSTQFNSTTDISGGTDLKKQGTVEAGIQDPLNLSKSRGVTRNIVLDASSLLGPFVSLQSSVPSRMRITKLYGKGNPALDVFAYGSTWSQEVQDLSQDTSLGTMPLEPEDPEVSDNTLSLDGLLDGTQGISSFRGEKDVRLRVFEGGNKVTDSTDRLYWYGIDQKLDQTDTEIRLDAELPDTAASHTAYNITYGVSSSGDREPPAINDISIPPYLPTDGSSTIKVEASDNTGVQSLNVEYRASTSTSSYWKSIEDQDKDFISRFRGSIDAESRPLDIKIRAEDTSGSYTETIIEKAVVERKNISFDLQGPEQAKPGDTVSYKGTCNPDGGCQGIRINLMGNDSSPDRVFSAEDEIDGVGIEGLFQEKIQLPDRQGSFNFTYSFDGMNSYAPISNGTQTFQTQLLNPSNSVFIRGEDRFFSSVQAAVNASEPRDTIVVTDRYTGVNDSAPLLINKPLNLTGQAGAEISGRAKNLALEVTASPVKISDLELTSAAAGILADHRQGKVTVQNVTVTGTGSTDYGGAVLTNPEGMLTVRDSTIINSSYGVYVSSDAGAYTDMSEASIQDSIEALETVESGSSLTDRFNSRSEDASLVSFKESISDTSHSYNGTGSGTSPVVVENSTFTQNFAGVLAHDGAEVRVNSSVFSSNTHALGINDSDLSMIGTRILENGDGLTLRKSSVEASMNSFVNNTDYGVSDRHSMLELENNWWGSNAGPTTYAQQEETDLEKRGDRLVSTASKPLEKARPWLPGRPSQTSPVDQSIALKTGWNTVSVPRQLKYPRWGDIMSQGVGISTQIAYRFDPEAGSWRQLNDDDSIEPLDAYYIKVDRPQGIGLNWSKSLQSPVSRELDDGWNFVGPKVSGHTKDPRSPSIDVSDALYTVEGLNEQDTGYSVVSSPGYNRDSWSMTPEIEGTFDMHPYSGYWVFMENEDTLAMANTTG